MQHHSEAREATKMLFVVASVAVVDDAL